MESPHNMPNIPNVPKSSNEEIPSTNLSLHTGPLKSPRNSRTVYGIFALVFLFVLALSALILTNISKDSLPNELLYRFKTKVAEPVTTLSKRTTDARVAYSTTLLETRLLELKTLYNDNATSTPEVLAVIAQLSDSHSQDALFALTDNVVSGTEKQIDTLAKLSNILGAQNALVNSTDEFKPITDSIQKTRETINEALGLTIETFASSSPAETVFAYAGVQIQEVISGMENIAYGSTAQKLVMRRMSDAQESLADSKMADAINYLLKARQAIAIDAYLWDSERGPVDGIPIEPTEMPLGS